MARKVFVVWACAAFIFILIGLKMREYKRDFLFQRNLLQSIAALETKQDEILKRLGDREGNIFGKKGEAFQRPPAEDPNKVYDIALGASPVKGDPNGQVTIVEFSDFECPFSQKFHPVVFEAVSTYPQGVRYVFKSFPLGYHPQARPAAKALWAAQEQGKYWEMMALLFQNAKNLSEIKIKECALQAGVNVDKFVSDLKEKEAQFEKFIEADIAAAEQAGVSGTPTFYINGKKTSARSVEALKQEIDQLLKK
jgi:protein-disulfide isomerase